MNEQDKIIRSHIINIIFTSILISIALLPLFHILIRPLTSWLQYTLTACSALFLLLIIRLRSPLQKWKKIHTAFAPKDREILLKEVEYYRTLSKVDRFSFEKKIQYFLASVSIRGIDTTLSDKDRILIAASAVIPVFKFPHWEYQLDSVLVYPRGFNEDFETDSDNNNIQGMVLLNNAMILSKKALEAGFQNTSDRNNVGIHEFAHKIDQADHHIDGVPSRLLKQPGLEKKWKALVIKEIQAIHDGESEINPYGGSSVVEFFAVASEYFFENPVLMSNKHPELYSIMKTMYRQDLKNILTRDFRRLFRKKHETLGRNSPCPCGSGKKYKHCCLPKVKG